MASVLAVYLLYLLYLPFFADPRLAVLQTPQTFYNPDMVQQNLGLGGGVADE